MCKQRYRVRRPGWFDGLGPDVGNYQAVWDALAKVDIKFNSELCIPFLILATTDLSTFELEHVLTAIHEVRDESKPVWWQGRYPCYGTYFQRVKSSVLLGHSYEELMAEAERVAESGLRDPVWTPAELRTAAVAATLK